MSIFPAVRPAVTPAVRGAFEQGSGGGAASIIAGLFAQGQQGFWLPFTDFDSLTQDSAGTLPYTALEQPVGRVLDRSGRGNHASQPTSTARGKVSARVNAFTETEFRGAGVNAGTNFTYSSLAGYLGALRFTLNAAGGYAYKSGSVAVGLICVFSVVVKMDDGSAPLTAGETPGNDFMLVVNGDPAQAASTVSLGGGLYRLTTAPILINSGNIGIVKYASNSAKPFTVTAYSLVPVAQSALPYQRVNTSTDYDAVGFPKFLRLDGTDDFYTCNGGGSTTGFYFSDVIRPMGGAGTRRVIWSDRSGNNGYELAINTANKLEFSAGNGSAITTVASTSSVVVTEGKRYEVMDDGTNLSVQIDGSAPVTVARPVVTAGSSTITLYRGASTGFFNGQATEPIYRAGPPPSAYEREVIRTYQMQKAGML